MVVGGMVLVILAFGLIGLTIAKNYGLRPKQIAYLQNAMRLFETEIAYGLTPLPVALKRVGMQANDIIRPLFWEAERMMTVERNNIQQSWQAGLDQLKQKTALGQGEYEALFYFGQSLGASDVTEQAKNFKLLDEQLKLFFSEAEFEKNKNQKIWQYLGFTFGMAVVLILI